MYELEYETEWEASPEFEFEGEGEFEFEGEGEMESEEFFRNLAGLARRAARSPVLRRVGLAAARSALGGLGDVGRAVGGAIAPSAAPLGRDLGNRLGGYLGGLLPQSEYEAEFEYEGEAQRFVNPLRRVYADALMEHMGHAAAQAESEAEAEAFIGALVPLAARLAPRVAPAIMRAAPGLIRGVAGVARVLRRNPATRQLVRTIPTIVRQTTGTLARQVAQGRRITPQTAVRTLARQTARVLSSPQQCTRAYRRSRALDRRFHLATGVRTPRRIAAYLPRTACPRCARRTA